MYCLDKLQNILSDYLHLDKEAMPNVKDILKDKGFTIVKKGDDFIELKDGELQKLKAIDLDSIDKSIQELDIEIDRVMKGKSLFEPITEAEKLRKAQRNLEYTKTYLEKLKGKEVEATPYATSLNKSINDNFFKIDKAREDLKQNINVENLNKDFLNTAKIKEIKEAILPTLKPIFNQKLTNKDNIDAYFNLKSLSKMLSDKAIQKSLDNGFSKAEHIQAVLSIEKLYKNSTLVKSEPHIKDNNTLIHRFNSDFENANALITSKESLDKNGNRLHTLELELTPRFNTETPLNNNINEGS